MPGWYSGEARSPVAAVLRAALLCGYPALKLHRVLRPSLRQGHLSLRGVRADSWRRARPLQGEDLAPAASVLAYAVCLCAALALEPLADLFLRWVPLYEWLKLAALCALLLGDHAVARRVEAAVLGPALARAGDGLRAAFWEDGKLKPLSLLARELGDRVTVPAAGPPAGAAPGPARRPGE